MSVIAITTSKKQIKNIKINKICNIKYDQRLSRNHPLEYKINTNIPVLDTPEENNRLRELLAIRQEVYMI